MTASADVPTPLHRRAVGKWRRYEEWLAPVRRFSRLWQAASATTTDGWQA
jgi:hypothetical protein